MEYVSLQRGEEGTECSIAKYGATLTSWKVKGEELIFVSPAAVLDGSKAIRGGIPVCFPSFGPWALGPQHGFARTSLWRLEGQVDTDQAGDVTAVLALEDGPHSSAWPHAFLLTLRVTLMESSIRLELGVENRNPDKALDFTTALHTYLRVPDVKAASIQGLSGLQYVDKTLGGTPTLTEDREKVTLSGWTDRVYLSSAPREVVVSRGAGAGSLVLAQSGLQDTVVWNPWPEKAAAMADLGQANSGGFLCVEAGQCVTPVQVAAGAKWSAVHSLAFTA